jgi:hypothetical protein
MEFYRIISPDTLHWFDGDGDITLNPKTKFRCDESQFITGFYARCIAHFDNETMIIPLTESKGTDEYDVHTQRKTFYTKMQEQLYVEVIMDKAILSTKDPT